MSITKLRNSSAKYMQFGLWAFLAIFLVSIFFWNTSYSSRSGQSGERGSVIATVNGNDIKNDDFQKRYLAQQDAYKGISAIQDAQIRSEIVSQLINEQIILSAAEKKGISAGYFDVRRERAKLVKEQIDQQKQLAAGKRGKLTDAEFDKLLRQTSPPKSLKALREEIEKELTTDKVKSYLMVTRLQSQLTAGVGKVDDQRLMDAFKQLKVRQILILSNNAPEQAKRKAEEVQKKLNAGEDFAGLARRFSDDTSTKNKGGDLGYIPVAYDKDLQELKVGQTSGIMKLPYGFRIVKVEDSKLELPKDFAKNKDQYKKQLVSQLQSEAMKKFFDDAQKSAKIEFKDPEFKGYWLAKQASNTFDSAERTKLFKQAVAALDKATKADDNNAPAFAEKAAIYQMLGESKKAIDVLVDILDKRQITEHQDLRMMLAQLYIQAGENENAVPQLKLVSEVAYDGQTHMTLKAIYKSIGHPELAAAEDKWMKDNPEQMKQMEQQQNPTPVKTEK